MVTFEESGMTFSFEEETLYRIEKSQRFCSIRNCSPCECVVWHDGKVVLIEAKSSSPRPEGKERFGEFINEITAKFTDSLEFFVAVHQKRHHDEVLPDRLQGGPLRHVNFQFFLIIKGHEKQWLPPLLDQLKKSMKKMLQMWGINDAAVKVINDQMALSKHLIVSTN